MCSVLFICFYTLWTLYCLQIQSCRTDVVLHLLLQMFVKLISIGLLYAEHICKYVIKQSLVYDA